MPKVLKTPYKKMSQDFVFSIFIGLWVKKKNPVKSFLLAALVCGDESWRSSPAILHSPSWFSHCNIPVTLLKLIYSPFQLIIFIMFFIFILWFILFLLRSCCPPSGGLSVEVELFMLHSVVLKCEILVLLLLPKNCLLYKRICILFFISKQQGNVEVKIWSRIRYVLKNA